jgi:feruloyl-CoA synthase
VTTPASRHQRILALDTIVRHGPGGVLYARSPDPLGPYPEKLTISLEHWARSVPDRPFLVQRDPQNAWHPITYGEMLARVRSVAQSLLDRNLSPDRPVVILSGNSIEHAVIALAAMYAGVLHAPVAPAYSLLARDYSTLRYIMDALTPGLVFVQDTTPFARAIAGVVPRGVEVVTCTDATPIAATAFGELTRTAPGPAVEDAHARVGPATIAKILFTSGSTGKPKGVINTQRMLCSNQEMLRTVLPLLDEEPPILCDWLPWNHTFGGNHNVGITLYNGGTLYIDGGKPTPAAFDATLANLREIATTAYFNVPRGYELLVPRLRAEPDFRRHFFSRMKMLFCAAASLRQQVADELSDMAVDADGRRIPLVTGLGATESAPFALCAGNATFTGGRIGVPVPGVELKLAPVAGRLEGRLRGPNITPGYWRDDALTNAAFDEEGFYKLGDALRQADPAEPSGGFIFEGRISEDFKLSTGTWVRVGPLRSRILARFGDLVQDVVISGHDRDFVGAMIFPAVPACAALARLEREACSVHDVLRHPDVRDYFRDLLRELARETPGSSTSVVRAILLEEPPLLDRQELTDKGTVNQKAVLTNRSGLVDQLHGPGGHATIIEVEESADTL